MNQLKYIFKTSETVSVRFWFALASIGFGCFMMFMRHTLEVDSMEYIYMFLLADKYTWGTLFILHGTALLYGALTGRFSNTLLIIEGVLGCAVWTVAAIAMTLSQGTPGPTVAGGLIAIWLLVRYPTHWEYFNEP